MLVEEIMILAKLLSTLLSQKPQETSAFVLNLLHQIEHDYFIRYLQSDQLSFSEVTKLYSGLTLHLKAHLSSEFQT